MVALIVGAVPGKCKQNGRASGRGRWTGIWKAPRAELRLVFLRCGQKSIVTKHLILRRAF